MTGGHDGRPSCLTIGWGNFDIGLGYGMPVSSTYYEWNCTSKR